jgi:2-keto-3-deoxy-L-rhamnonate aldolase RhmA
MTKPDETEFEITILKLTAERGDGRTIGPSDVARALGGDHPDGWGPLMQPIRRVAVRLMKEGKIVITRKGRPVDPDDFRGVYRLRLPEGE